MSDSFPLDGRFDTALQEALAGMAFADFDRIAEGDLGDLATFAIWVRVEVKDPAAGELVLLVGESDARQLAESATGDDDPNLAVCLDVLEEMLNVVAGGWARALMPDGRPTAIGIPKSGRGSWEEGGVYEVAIYETEEAGRLAVALRRSAA